MSAEDNLSQQLFHGTHARLKKGDIILPHGKLENGTSNFGETSKPNLAYATPDIDDAKYFAFHAATHYGQSGKTAHVYEVEPVGETKVKKMFPKNSDGSDRIQHVSKEGFKVKRRVASKTPKPNETVAKISSKTFWESK